MVTVKIDERTKEGKALLDFLKTYSTKSKGVEIVKNASSKTGTKDYPISKNIPNAETLKAMQEAEEGIGVKAFDNIEDLIAELDS